MGTNEHNSDFGWTVSKSTANEALSTTTNESDVARMGKHTF